MPFIAGRSSASKGYSGFASVPAAPAAPVVSNGCINTTYNWTKPADNGLDVKKYEYQVSINDGAWSASTETTSLNHSINTQYNTNIYKIRVRAFNAYGWGPWSSASSNNIPWTVETDNTCTDGTCFDNTCTDGTCYQEDTSCTDGSCYDLDATCDSTCTETDTTCNECAPCSRNINCGSCGLQLQTRTSSRTRTRTRSRFRTRTRKRTRTRTRQRSRTRTRSRLVNPSVGCTAQEWSAWTYSDGGSETVWNAPWVYSDGGSAAVWVLDYGAWIYTDWTAYSSWTYSGWSVWSSCSYGEWTNSGGCGEIPWVVYYGGYGQVVSVSGGLFPYAEYTLWGWFYTTSPSGGTYPSCAGGGIVAPTNVQKCDYTNSYRVVLPNICAHPFCC